MLIIGIQQVADLFGVSHQSIANWQDDGMPVAVRGGPNVASQFDSAACIHWYIDRELHRASSEAPRERLFRLQAESLEIDLAAKRSTLIPAAQLEPRLKAVVSVARDRLQGEPARLAGLTEGLVMRAREDLLRDNFEAFLHRLARPHGEADP